MARAFLDLGCYLGIGGVATLPPARSQGGIRAIFEEQLPDSYRKGYVLSMLFPFSHRFYRKFGYELVQRSHYYTIPLQSLAPFAQALQVTLVTEGAELQAIHDAFGKQCSLSIHRKPNQWHFVSKDPVKAVNFTYKIGDVAFLTIRAMDGEPDTLHVRDLGYSGKEGLRALLGFLYTMRASYEKARLCLPDSVPLADMIPECYEVKDTRSAHGMARIVNVRRALELMPYPGRDGSRRSESVGTVGRCQREQRTRTCTPRPTLPTSGRPDSTPPPDRVPRAPGAISSRRTWPPPTAST